MFPRDLEALAQKIVERYGESNLTAATAESCTGGLVAACLTAIPGSSAVIDRAFVTYSNTAKEEMLGVPAALIADKGAVSAEVAEAMLAGVLERSPVGFAISITGIAGPGGATPEKPVGLVYIGAQRRGEAAHVERHVFSGGRAAVRAASVKRALELMADQVEDDDKAAPSTGS